MLTLSRKFSPQSCFTLGLLLSVMMMAPPAWAEEEENTDEGHLAVVSANPAKIMDGTKVLATVPRGTPLWIFKEQPGWAQVKVPNGEQRGWMTDTSLQEIQYTAQQEEQRAQALKHYEQYETQFDEEDFEAARKSLEACLRLERAVYGPNNPELARTLNDLGYLATSQEDYANARKFYDEALAINRKFFGQDYSRTGYTLHNLGDLCHAQGDHVSAKKFFEQALAVLQKHFGDGQLETAETHVSLGSLAFDQGLYAEAQKRYEAGLAIYRKNQQDKNVDTALVINDLGLVCHRQNDFSGAKKYYEEALAIFREVPGDQQSNTAMTLNNLGLNAIDQADYPAARKLLDESLAIYRKVHRGDHADIAMIVGNLGLLANYQGDLAAARKFYDESLAIYRRVYEGEHLDIARTINNLGTLELEQKNYAAAKDSFDEALVIYQVLLGKEHPDTAMMLVNLGIVALEQDDLPTAQKFLDQSLAISRKAHGSDHADTAEVLECLGRLALKKRDYATAWKHYNESLAINRRIFGKDHPQTVTTLGELAALAYLEQEDDDARRRWDEVRRILRRYTQYLLPALSANEQMRFMEQVFQPNLFDSLSYAWLRHEDQSAANLSAAWLLNGKAIAQESLAERELIARDLSNPQLAPRVKELQDVRQQLASLSLSAPKPNEAAAHQARLLQLSNDEYRLSQSLAQETGNTGILREWVELGQVRRSMSPDSLYLDFVKMPIRDFQTRQESPPHYLVWVIPPHAKGQVQILDLGEAEAIERAIEQARTSLAAAAREDSPLRSEGEVAATAQTTRDLQAAANLVLKPLLAQLGETKQLVLAPDGALWLLPWSALPIDQDKCLLEKCSVRFVLSGRDLLKKEEQNEVVTGVPAIFANPNYDLAAPAAKTTLKTVLPDTTFDETSTRSAVTQSRLSRVEPLPYTAFEAQLAQAIMAKLAKTEPKSFQEAQALEEVAKKLFRPRQLLFATHGFFLPDQHVKQSSDRQSTVSKDSRPAIPLTADGQLLENPLLRCGLLLAGCNTPRSAGLDDGILTGLEIVGLDLRGTELVVLSACETGVGKVRNGEGVAGLRQAFRLAGAQTIVSTLWQVPDRDSTLIMQDYFKNLVNGQSNAEALRAAQLKRIAERREKNGAAHPFFWAAWTVTGN